jgi:tetratricopeptide (TPR) repeat protein
VPEAQESPVFSRIIRMTVGQTLEVPFRGTGWVYLGESQSRRGITYLSRRLDTEGQSFVFRADEPGTFDLKFYKQDFLRDYILNDYVRVIVNEAPEQDLFVPREDRGRVVASPRWPLTPGEAELPGQTPAPGDTGSAAQPGGAVEVPGIAEVGMVPESPAESSREGAQGTASALTFPPGAFPEDFLRRAREEAAAGRMDAALEILDLFRERYPAGSDEAWWLYGQILEANSANRDIRAALEYYRRLVREYPQSPRYDDARRRIAYLERFYFNIQ